MTRKDAAKAATVMVAHIVGVLCLAAAPVWLVATHPNIGLPVLAACPFAMLWVGFYKLAREL